MEKEDGWEILNTSIKLLLDFIIKIFGISIK